MKRNLKPLELTAGVLQHFKGIKVNDSYNHASAKALAAVGAEVLLEGKGALVHYINLYPPAQIPTKILLLKQTFKEHPYFYKHRSFISLLKFLFSTFRFILHPL